LLSVWIIEVFAFKTKSFENQSFILKQMKTIFFLMGFLGSLWVEAQSLQNDVLNRLQNCKSFRMQVNLSSRAICNTYERDFNGNEHYIFINTAFKDKNLAFIKIKNATYCTHWNTPWRNSSAPVPYTAWMDSCKAVSQIFSHPSWQWIHTQSTPITGTNYNVSQVLIEKDTFRIWEEPINHQITCITGYNRQKRLHYKWQFDLPFQISAPIVGANESKNFGYTVFPPEYAMSEEYDGTEPILVVPDLLPQFKEGTDELFKILYQKIKYPSALQQAGIDGVLKIRFVVEKEGHISNVTVSSSLDKGYEEQVLYVVNDLSGKWIAGSYDGKKVRAIMTLPMKFKWVQEMWMERPRIRLRYDD
jgi:TonB family protein